MLSNLLLYAQDETHDDLINDPSKYSPPSPEFSSFKSTATMKLIRVNIHYLLKDDGSGNFSETWDGVDASNDWDGYKYAEILIEKGNGYLSNNVTLNHQPIPSVTALPINYKYVLSGVFFHRNDNLYNATNEPLGSLGVYTKDDAIDIFLTTWGGGGGRAFLNGTYSANWGYYDDYLEYIGGNQDRYWYFETAFSRIVNHEVGHNLSLSHPLRLGGGACCDGSGPDNPYCDDGISDTPTWQELFARGFDDPCKWNSNDNSHSNNMMGASASTRALSPLQIEAIHSHIENYKSNTYSCYYPTQTINLATKDYNFEDNESYIAKYINIPSSSSININNGNAIYLNAQEVTIDGELTIKEGSIFQINITSACDPQIIKIPFPPLELD